MSKNIYRLNRLPASLSKKIELHKIGGILIEAKKDSEGFSDLTKFMREYIPPIRYYNPNLTVDIQANTSLLTPRILVHDHRGSLINEIQILNISKDEILEEILSTDLKE